MRYIYRPARPSQYGIEWYVDGKAKREFFATAQDRNTKGAELALDCPKLIRFAELAEDEVFCTESAARAGVVFENTSDVEPLVVVRYFGPEVNPNAPDIGAHRFRAF